MGRGKAPPRRGIVVVGAVVALVTLAGAAFMMVSSRVPALEVPDPNLSVLEPQVASKIGDLRAKVMRQPRSAAAWGALAMNFDVHHLADEALQAYQQANRLDPRDVRWPYFAAVALRSIRALEAVKWFERARKILPDYAPLLVRYGGTLADLGDFDGASRQFHNAIAADPRSAHAYLGLARIAVAKGDVEGSERNIIAALKIAPRYGEVHGLLSGVYRNKQLPTEARLASLRARQFSKAVPLPDSIFVQLVQEGVSSYWFLRRGKAYTQAGMYEAARKEFQQAVKVRADAETHFHLGLALQYSGQTNIAVQEFRTALEQRPDYPIALRHLGAVLFDMGRRNDAVRELKRARQLDPAVPDAYLTLGMFYEKMKSHANAIDVYSDGMSNAPYDYRIATRLAFLLATVPMRGLRNGGEAVRLAETASRVVGGVDPEALDALAAAYAETGEFDRALATAQQALRMAEAAQGNALVDGIHLRIKQYRTKLGR